MDSVSCALMLFGSFLIYIVDYQPLIKLSLLAIISQISYFYFVCPASICLRASSYPLLVGSFQLHSSAVARTLFFPFSFFKNSQL